MFDLAQELQDKVLRDGEQTEEEINTLLDEYIADITSKIIG
jgi:hypothetical protein